MIIYVNLKYPRNLGILGSRDRPIPGLFPQSREMPWERGCKEGHKQKMCKIGLSLGRNQLKVEGNFQFGYHSEIDKKYHAVDGEPQEEDISEINKKYEVVHAKHLPVIPEEEEEENGRVPDTTVLQS